MKKKEPNEKKTNKKNKHRNTISLFTQGVLKPRRADYRSKLYTISNLASRQRKTAQTKPDKTITHVATDKLTAL
jgi:hypothetical protein